MLLFFLLFYFCIFWHVVTSVLHNCLFVCLLAFLLFGIICIFSCLPYFLQSFNALLNCFFQANYSCLQLFDVCRLLAVPLPRFGQLAFTLDSFFLCYRLALMYISLPLIWFTLLLSFCWGFFARFVLGFFALQISWLHQFALARFRFFWRRCLFCCLLFAYEHSYRTAHLLLSLNSST